MASYTAELESVLQVLAVGGPQNWFNIARGVNRPQLKVWRGVEAGQAQGYIVADAQRRFSITTEGRMWLRSLALAHDQDEFAQRLQVDHGVPAELCGFAGRGHEQRSTRVKVPEAGDYWLHLVVDDAGWVRAVFNRHSAPDTEGQAP